MASRSNWSKISRTTAWTCSSGSIAHSPVGEPDVADRRGAEQLAAAGLVQLALVHPLLEDVKLRLAHHPVQARAGGGPSGRSGRTPRRRRPAGPGTGRTAPAGGASPCTSGPAGSSPGRGSARRGRGRPRPAAAGTRAGPRSTGRSCPGRRRWSVTRSRGQPEGDGAVGQGVLAGGRLLVVEDLLRGRLADVDDGRRGRGARAGAWGSGGAHSWPASLRALAAWSRARSWPSRSRSCFCRSAGRWAHTGGGSSAGGDGRRQARGGAGRRVVSGMRLLRWGRPGVAGTTRPARATPSRRW